MIKYSPADGIMGKQVCDYRTGRSLTKYYQLITDPKKDYSKAIISKIVMKKLIEDNESGIPWDSLLFVTCSAGMWYNASTGEQDTISGQVQLWNTNTMSLIDTLQFTWKSKPWHIVKSPNKEQVFVIYNHF